MNTHKRLYERGLSHPARADHRDEFVHVDCLRGRPGSSTVRASLSLLAEGGRVEELHIRNKPASIQLFDRDGLWQKLWSGALNQLAI